MKPLRNHTKKELAKKLKQTKKDKKRFNRSKEKQILPSPKPQKASKIIFNTFIDSPSSTRTKAQILTQLRKESFSQHKIHQIPKWIMFSLIYLTEATFIFSTDFSKIFESKMSPEQTRSRNFFSERSLINSFLNYFSIVDLVRAINPASIVLIFSLIFLIQFFFIMLYWWTSRVDNLLLSFKDREGKVKIRKFMIQLYHFYFVNFDLFFLLVNYLCVGSVFCRWIEVPFLTGNEEKLLNSSLRNDYFSKFSDQVKANKEVVQVNFLNDDVKCSNSNAYKIVFNIFGILIFCLNLALKFIFNKVYCFVPTVSIPQSKFNNFDFLIDFSMLVMIIFRVTSTLYIKDDFEKIKLFMLVLLIFLTGITAILYKKYPYYNEHFFKMKTLQMHFLLTLIGIHIVISYQIFGSSEIKSIVFFFMTMTISLRIWKNSEMLISPSTIIKKILNGETLEDLTRQEILNIYYQIQKFIREEIHSRSNQDVQNKKSLRITLMITTLYESHRRNCSNPSCHCQGKSLYSSIQNTPLSEIFKKQEKIIFKQPELIVKGLLVCKKIFERKIKTESGDLLFFSYLDLLIYYTGELVRASMEIKKKTKFVDSHKNWTKETNIGFEMIKNNLEIVISLNQKTGCLALAYQSDAINQLNGIENRFFNFENYILILNSVEKLKIEVRNCAKIKLDILEYLLENPESRKIFEKVKIFATTTVFVSSFAEHLLIQTKGHYEPLLLFLWKYYQDISEDYLTSNECLTLLKKSRNKVFLKLKNSQKKFIEKNSIGSSYEFSLIYVSGEGKTFQKINYCTSNIYDYTGWEIQDLKENSLELILPKPFKNIHSQLMKKKNFNEFFFMKGHLRNLFCLNKKGDLRNVKLNLRLNTNSSMDLQYIGIMQFSADNKHFDDNHCVVMTNQTGDIKSMTKKAKKFFTEGENIFEYNEKFKKIYKSFDFITKDQKKIDEEYFKILENENSRSAWKNYQKWTGFNQITIGENTFKMKIENYSITQLNQFVRFLIIENVNDENFFQTFDNQNGLGLDLSLKERKNIKSMLLERERQEREFFNSKKILKQTKEQTSKIKISLDYSQDIGHLEKKINNFPDLSSEKKNLIDNEENKFRSNKNNSKELESEILEYELKNDNWPLGMGINIYDRDLKLKKVRNNPEFKLSKLIHHHPNLNLIRGLNHFMNSPDKITRLAEIKHSILDSFPRNILFQKINIVKNARFHRSTKILLSILGLILIINFFLIETRNRIQKSASEEIPKTIVIVDIACWVSWVQLYGIASLESNRIIREGWVKKTDVSKYIEAPNFWEGPYKDSRESAVWNFVNVAEKSLKKEVSKFEFPQYYNSRNNFFNDKLEVEFYEVKPSEIRKDKVNAETNYGLISINNETKWYNLTMERYDASRILNLAGITYLRRNYENDSLEDIPSLGETRNRNNDLFEDFLRKLLIGEKLETEMMRTSDFYEYMKAVCVLNQEIIFMTSFGAVVTCGTLLIGFMMYLKNLETKMNKLYKLLFNLKILQENIENYKKKVYALSYVLNQEKVMELNLSTESESRLKLSSKATEKTTKNEFSGEDILHISKKRRRRRKSFKRRKYLTTKIQKNRSSFDLSKIFISLSIIILIYLILHTFVYLIFNPRASRIKNLAKVTIFSSALYNSYFIVQISVLETLLYNNTVKMLDNLDSENTYYKYREIIKNTILKNMTESLDYDLGNYTDQYRNDLTNGNSCEVVFYQKELDKKALSHCDEWYDGLMNSNLLSSLKGILTALDSVISDWKQKRGSWEEIDKLLLKPSMLVPIGQLRRMWMVLYYWISTPTSAIIEQQIIDDFLFSEVFDRFIHCFVIVGSIYMYFQVILKLQKIMILFKFSIRVLPLGVVRKHALIFSRLRRIQNGEKCELLD